MNSARHLIVGLGLILAATIGLAVGLGALWAFSIAEWGCGDTADAQSRACNQWRAWIHAD